MLDERQIRVCHLLSIGTPAIDIAKEIGISRTSVYDWKKNTEVMAMLEELAQGFIFSTKQACISFAPKAMNIIRDLAEHATSEKIRLEAAKILIDKTISNAVKIELTNGDADKDSVPMDLLDEEFKEFDTE